MTAPHILNPAQLLDNALSGASPDLMRDLLTTVINALLSAEADAVCGAEYGQASTDRTNSGNGYRHRELDTRAGTLDVAVPKLRTGSYFPEWLLERRKRAEAALISVVADLLPARGLHPPDGQTGVDTPLAAAIENLGKWMASIRNQRSDAHHGPAPDKRDAELAVRVVGLLVLRFG